MNTLPYLLLRLAVGVSLFGHGLVRLPKLAAFSHWMVASFEKSILPQALVTPFSYVLPVAEFTIGLLLIIGLFTRAALIAGSLVMMALTFGCCMIENWEAIPSQLLHAAILVVLLQFVESNTRSIDQLMAK
ncbi:DoxX family protein [Mucilaginibacter sp. Bleaf8]|uniref:DoxX family protein n=1 Tax=Mucilaginibacter sp. Bleaf8 TaxID=2834430 RepID=UPI001BD034A9|nr:DoxX family protein [Mucilaginibacter sp. Bleaf8]MBS7564844.1 DoxX family protein [Mucilaginibacter sp. Bleaf8]